jgi:hypothetical protein
MVHNFVSDSPGDDARLPEEVVIISESVSAVSRAKRLLSEMNQDQVRGIVEKQAARHILWKQAEYVDELLREGLLSSKDAETFYKEISIDVKRVEKLRRDMNRRQSRVTADILRSSNTSTVSLSFRDPATASDIYTHLMSASGNHQNKLFNNSSVNA